MARAVSIWRTVALLAALSACSEAWLPAGPADTFLLDGMVKDLSPAQRAVHLRGDGEFSRHFAPIDGLGPLFVATSCDACHAGDGKGHPVFDITRFGRTSPLGFDPMLEVGGPQLQHRAIHGYAPERVPAEANATARFTAPSVTGLGFLEAVEDATILAMADPDDRDGDGISGRASLVDSSDLITQLVSLSDIAGGSATGRHVTQDGQFIGRFGKKARAINLLHQTIVAYAQDMGITTHQAPHDLYHRELGVQADDGVADPEVSSGVVNDVVFYLRTLRKPPRRDLDVPAVQDGAARFVAVGCSACHVLQLTTGRSDMPSLNVVTFAPFTDLLLHDMGPELDDGYTEGNATSAEWRTAPLWGLGLASRAQGGRMHLLHDGRAASLREAIAFHGGEGAASRLAVQQLSPAQQENLLAYLRSL